MKKFLALAILGAMAASMAVSASAVVGNPEHANWTATKGTPTIDGKKDDCYAGTAIACNVWDPEEAHLQDQGANGVIYVAWDENYLYAYCEVTDPTNFDMPSNEIWETDSMELYFDLGNIDTVVDFCDDEPDDHDPYWLASQFTAGYAYRDYETGENLARQGGGLWYDSVDYEACFDVDFDPEVGYAVEFKIPLPNDEKNEEGEIIGFHAAINDEIDGDGERDCGPRTAQRDGIGMSWTQTEGWDNLTLAAAPATTLDEPTETPADKPEQKPTQTSDAGIVVAASVMAVAAGVILSKKR